MLWCIIGVVARILSNESAQARPARRSLSTSAAPAAGKPQRYMSSANSFRQDVLLWRTLAVENRRESTELIIDHLCPPTTCMN